jgi:hypothetical protein
MNAKLCLAKDETKLQGSVFPSKTWGQVETTKTNFFSFLDSASPPIVW